MQAQGIFVNLPVKDLNRSIAFFSEIGFEFNAQYTDEKSTSMLIGKNMFAMLLKEEFFQTFIKNEISDAEKTTEVIVALSVDSKDKVDEIVNKALTAGGLPSYGPKDYNHMYVRSFQDPDGHLWEVFFMEPGIVEGI